jgi:hypothetical protein
MPSFAFRHRAPMKFHDSSGPPCTLPNKDKRVRAVHLSSPPPPPPHHVPTSPMPPSCSVLPPPDLVRRSRWARTPWVRVTGGATPAVTTTSTASPTGSSSSFSTASAASGHSNAAPLSHAASMSSSPLSTRSSSVLTASSPTSPPPLVVLPHGLHARPWGLLPDCARRARRHSQAHPSARTDPLSLQFRLRLLLRVFVAASWGHVASLSLGGAPLLQGAPPPVH